MKLLSSQYIKGPNKLECLFVTRLSSLLFANKAFLLFPSRVSSSPYWQTLQYAGKAYQGQTLTYFAPS
jgi:hypothetical protein